MYIRRRIRRRSRLGWACEGVDGVMPASLSLPPTSPCLSAAERGAQPSSGCDGCVCVFGAFFSPAFFVHFLSFGLPASSPLLSVAVCVCVVWLWRPFG